MSGRGCRKRGRPPKTPNERVGTKFNYQLLKKPKYLSKASDSQLSTPSASRASSPQESDGSRSYNRKSTSKSTRGRSRKSTSSTANVSRRGGNTYTRKQTNLFTFSFDFRFYNMTIVLKCIATVIFFLLRLLGDVLTLNIKFVNYLKINSFLFMYII